VCSKEKGYLKRVLTFSCVSYPWSCGRGREECDADDLDGDDVPEQDHNNQYTIAANFNFIYF